MKKIITCMIFGLLSLISCTEYDEIAIWNKSEYIDSRLTALEELCSRMNTNITSLQLIVEALQGNDYVTGVTPVVENGENDRLHNHLHQKRSCNDIPRERRPARYGAGDRDQTGWRHLLLDVRR